MGWTKQARQRVNPLGIRKGDVFKSTDDRPDTHHYDDHYVVERVSYIRGEALVTKHWLDTSSGRLHKLLYTRKTWVKLTRFTPHHHLRHVPDYTYRIAA